MVQEKINKIKSLEPRDKFEALFEIVDNSNVSEIETPNPETREILLNFKEELHIMSKVNNENWWEVKTVTLEEHTNFILDKCVETLES